MKFDLLYFILIFTDILANFSSENAELIDQCYVLINHKMKQLFLLVLISVNSDRTKWLK